MVIFDNVLKLILNLPYLDVVLCATATSLDGGRSTWSKFHPICLDWLLLELLQSSSWPINLLLNIITCKNTCRNFRACDFCFVVVFLIFSLSFHSKSKEVKEAVPKLNESMVDTILVNILTLIKQHFGINSVSWLHRAVGKWSSHAR